jgi:hypothetical protein
VLYVDGVPVVVAKDATAAVGVAEA